MPMHSHTQPAQGEAQQQQQRLPPLVQHRHSLEALPIDADRADREALEFLLQQRHSAPLLPRHSLTGKETPESVLMHTTVLIKGAARRPDHCVYGVEVSTGYDTRVLFKRYSEFREFRADLLQVLQRKQTHCNRGPCAQLLAQVSQVKFPRRRLKLPMVDDGMDLAHVRQLQLERFLQVLLRVYRLSSRRHMRRCMHSECIVADMIKRFLQIVEVTPTPTAAELNASDCEADSPVGTSAEVEVDSKLQAPQQSRLAKRPAKDVWLFPIYEDGELLLAPSS